jgi:hypothetical protein
MLLLNLRAINMLRLHLTTLYLKRDAGVRLFAPVESRLTLPLVTDAVLAVLPCKVTLNYSANFYQLLALDHVLSRFFHC